MGIMSMVLLTIGPFIVYKVVLWWINNKFDFEMEKRTSYLLFITIDILIMIVYYSVVK